MKYFAAFLLALSAFIGSNQLAASEDSEHLTHHWTGDEEYLHLNINLIKEIEFASTYTTFKTNNGQGCEIICKPTKGSVVLSSDGYKLKEIKLTVIVKNVKKGNEVNYTISTLTSYKSVNFWEFLTTRTVETEAKGSLYNPAIDLKQAPAFFILDETSNEGFFSFKNSFPYSKNK